MKDTVLWDIQIDDSKTKNIEDKHIVLDLGEENVLIKTTTPLKLKVAKNGLENTFVVEKGKSKLKLK